MGVGEGQAGHGLVGVVGTEHICGGGGRCGVVNDAHVAHGHLPDLVATVQGHVRDEVSAHCKQTPHTHTHISTLISKQYHDVVVLL
jgi:hypothetical protein